MWLPSQQGPERILVQQPKSKCAECGAFISLFLHVSFFLPCLQSENSKIPKSGGAYKDMSRVTETGNMGRRAGDRKERRNPRKKGKWAGFKEGDWSKQAVGYDGT